MNYPLARQGVFKTIQGEGVMMGVPMIFVRLAGCSVGCPLCDTDYRIFRRAAPEAIVAEALAFKDVKWAWITGGEPADYDLSPLIDSLHKEGLNVAIATSGAKSLRQSERLADFLSVSPHGEPTDLAVRCGDSVNLVPGLNGLRLADWDGVELPDFIHHFVTPCWTHQGERMDNVRECVAFVERNPNFRLGIQAHKFWGLA